MAQWEYLGAPLNYNESEMSFIFFRGTLKYHSSLGAAPTNGSWTGEDVDETASEGDASRRRVSKSLGVCSRIHHRYIIQNVTSVLFVKLNPMCPERDEDTIRWWSTLHVFLGWQSPRGRGVFPRFEITSVSMEKWIHLRLWTTLTKRTLWTRSGTTTGRFAPPAEHC